MTYERILASLEAQYKAQVDRVADLKKAVQLARDLGEDMTDEVFAVEQAEAQLKRTSEVIAKHKAQVVKK